MHTTTFYLLGVEYSRSLPRVVFRCNLENALFQTFEMSEASCESLAGKHLIWKGPSSSLSLPKFTTVATITAIVSVLVLSIRLPTKLDAVPKQRAGEDGKRHQGQHTGGFPTSSCKVLSR